MISLLPNVWLGTIISEPKVAGVGGRARVAERQGRKI